MLLFLRDKTMPSLLLKALPATFLILSSAAFGAVPQQVKTDKGVVEGETTTDGKVMAFKGIPFAAPPVGKLRWAPPAPAEPWQGFAPRTISDITAFNPLCIEIWPFMIPVSSEDCLTLNVWTPADAQPGKLAVMVWIYGGGYSGGSTSEYRQDGEFLAHRNVVVVSMNYRLGVFGFFVHPELAAESPHHAAGNYGLMDQTAAIRWVKENISAFGGDPSNITIFGESADRSPSARRWLHRFRAICFRRRSVSSGGALCGSSRGRDQTLEQREKTDSAFALAAYGTSKLSRAAPPFDGGRHPSGAGGQSRAPVRPGGGRLFLSEAGGRDLRRW